MEGKIIFTGNSGIIEGVNVVADTVKVTLGPKGRCVSIADGLDTPNITRDGATVARNINFSDPVKNMGAQLVKSQARLTEAMAGDSTSSTVVLMQEIIQKGIKALNDGQVHNVNEIKKGIEKGRDFAIEFIKNNSIEIDNDLEKIRKVATISANNDAEVGNFIVEGMKKVGIDGVITAEMANGLETSLDVKDGFRIDRGWASPHFVTDAKTGICELINPTIAVIGERLSTIPQLQKLIMSLSDPTTGGITRPILFIVDDIDDNVMGMLVMNVLRGALQCCVVKGIDFGDARKNLMADISVSVGSIFVCPENNLKVEDADGSIMGEAQKVVISKDTCTIYGGAGDPNLIQERLDVLKAKIEDPGTSDYEKTKLQKRISSLGNGICIINAGGASEVEKVNRKATIEDAILASKAAIAEGIVPGGGCTYLKAKAYVEQKAKSLKGDEKIGAIILADSLPVITETIAENSGLDGHEVATNLARTRKLSAGYDAKNNVYGDLIELGVLDSAKGLRVALENAVSGANMCLLTEKVVVPEPEKKGCHCGCNDMEPKDFGL